MPETRLEQAKNRPNKEVYFIRATAKPQEFLHPDVAHPDQVKYLLIFLDLYGVQGETDPEYKQIKRQWNTNSKQDIYTNTLCKDIVNFKNLKLLKATDLKLTHELWIEFAKNSTCLNEIYFSDENLNYDTFKFEPSTIEAIFNIPTLKRVTLNSLVIPVFPPGPNNIEYLKLNVQSSYWKFEHDDENESEKFIESWTTNLRTYTNLKVLKIRNYAMLIHTIEPFVDLGLTCTQLEEVTIEHKIWRLPKRFWDYHMLADRNLIRDTLLTIPTLKKLVI
jgi:hypothetical protein